MEFFPVVQGFEWDDANREKNWKTHRVAWGECEEVFFNFPLYVLPDIRHSVREHRYFAFGRTNMDRLLLIVFTIRTRRIRVVSARDMNKRERKFYHEKAEEDSQV